MQSIGNGSKNQPKEKEKKKGLGSRGISSKSPLVAAAAAKAPVSLRRRAQILPFNFHFAPPADQCEALGMGRRTSPTISKVL